MSYFNDDQRDYMRELAAIPPDSKCWCGWYRLGKCFNCNRKHPGKTRADFLKVACQKCYTLPPLHVIGCSNQPPASTTAGAAERQEGESQ